MYLSQLLLMTIQSSEVDDLFTVDTYNTHSLIELDHDISWKSSWMIWCLTWMVLSKKNGPQVHCDAGHKCTLATSR